MITHSLRGWSPDEQDEQVTGSQRACCALVQEARKDYPSLWSAVGSIAPGIGCTGATLHDWVKKHKIDTGVRDGVTTVGSQGDSCDNALAGTLNGLYKAEPIHRRAPWKTGESLELATLEWGTWFNHPRLPEPLGYLPPAKAEQQYCQQLTAQVEHACT